MRQLAQDGASRALEGRPSVWRQRETRVVSPAAAARDPCCLPCCRCEAPCGLRFWPQQYARAQNLNAVRARRVHATSGSSCCLCMRRASTSQAATAPVAVAARRGPVLFKVCSCQCARAESLISLWAPPSRGPCANWRRWSISRAGRAPVRATPACGARRCRIM